ncbi:MAG: putative toxin-antitoxin system toxin component, PIN family [Anaerolineaceae bacterium]|nr:putative toxin-antitoxin system toxin component, PIN family [Anaerolineaceae bacterium]
MLVVLDTNVLVSGLLNGAGSPGQVLDLLLDGHLNLAYDDRIMGEYEDVLARPELHLPQTQVKEVLNYFELSGLFIDAETLSPLGFPDPGDLPFAEVFISSNSKALITGNLRHFAPLIEKGLRVISPKQFLDEY